MKHFIILSALSIGLISCKEEVTPSNLTPACIQEKIAEYLNDGSFCEDGRVVEYSFQRNFVYAFERGSCIADVGVDIFTHRCEDLCFIGGFGGIEECNGDDFYDNAIETRVVFPE